MRWRIASAASAVLLLLAGCGGSGGGEGDGGSAAAPVLSGGVVKGPVSGATVCVYALGEAGKGALIPVSAATGASGSVRDGCYVTGDDGRYSLVLPAGTVGDVLVESTGGKFCRDESPLVNGRCADAAGQVSLPEAAMSTAVTLVAGGSTTSYVTPLSTAAVGSTQGRLSASAFSARFATLAGYAGLESGVTPATPPAPENQPYLPKAATFLWETGGDSLTAFVKSLQDDRVAASVPAALARDYAGFVEEFFCGDRYVQYCNYAPGDHVPFAIAADGTLTIEGRTIARPFLRLAGGVANPAEILWRDGDLEYALALDAAGAVRFLETRYVFMPEASGRARLQARLWLPRSDPALVAGIVGNYPVSLVYRGNAVPWTDLTVAADGSITIREGATVRYAITPATTARMHAVGREIRMQPLFDQNGDGRLSADDQLVLELAGPQLVAARLPQGSPSKTLGLRLVPLPAMPAHDGTAVPSENAVRGTLNGVALNQGAMIGGGDARSFWIDSVPAGSPDFWTLNVVAEGPIVAGQTYGCGAADGGTPGRAGVALRLAGQDFYSGGAARCRVTIASYVLDGAGNLQEVSGTFTLEVFPLAASPTPGFVSNGVFRRGG